MKSKGEKSAGKEDISIVAQPEQALEQVPGSSLLSEAKGLGWKYWLRVLIGLLFVMFFSAWVPNAYLQYSYSNVFQESPCTLCLELNQQTAGLCFMGAQNKSFIGIPETRWLTLHPIKELETKARWLQVPCNVCGEVEGGNLQSCLNQTFMPKNEINKKQNLSSNFSFIPEEDISS